MRKPWTQDSVGRLVVVIPPSVDRVGDLSNPGLLAEAYPGAEWQPGRKLVIPADRFVHLVDSVRLLASDQITEDLSVGGALRWTKRIGRQLVEAGLAKWNRWGGIEPVGAR